MGFIMNGILIAMGLFLSVMIGINVSSEGLTMETAFMIFTAMTSIGFPLYKIMDEIHNPS